MALRWADNFEFWTTMPGTFTTVSSNAPTISSGSLSCPFNDRSANVALSAQATWIVNIRFTVDVAVTGSLISLWDSTSAQVTLVLKSTGKLAVYRGEGNGTQIGSDSTHSFTTGTDYDVEFKVTIDNASGVIGVKVNGATEISASSLDTQATGNATADAVRLGHTTGDTSGATWLFRHAVIMDSSGSEMNDYIGPVAVNLHKPSGAGNYSQFTPSAGSNYQNVDDTANDGDSTYNASGTLNQIDTYAMENCPAGVTSVKGVALWWNARRDDATTRGLSPVWRISATDYVGTEQNVGASYAFFTQNYALSPATSTAWTSSEIDGAEAGIKVTT